MLGKLGTFLLNTEFSKTKDKGYWVVGRRANHKSVYLHQNEMIFSKFIELGY